MLLRIFETLFSPISGLSLNKFLHHPLQHLFHSTHCLFHAVSSSSASKYTYSLFHTFVKFTTFLTHLRLSTGQLRTARNMSEHPRIHQHHWFYGGYIKRLFTYYFTYYFHNTVTFENIKWIKLNYSFYQSNYLLLSYIGNLRSVIILYNSFNCMK